jgi:steroid 5-alpha reductase family enzyme
MTPGYYLLAGWLALALCFAMLWLVCVRTRDASHVDVGWALGLGLMAAFAAAALPGEPARRGLLAVMACGWSLRLGGHLYVDRVKGKPEDGRYAALRAKWGERANRNFFFFFQAQALLDVLLALPFVAVASKQGPLGALDWAGLALWIVSVGGETAADRQLAAFRSEPANKGTTCRAGLWSWSRHPNYFFEWTHWLAYAVMVPGDWRVWTAPPLMLFFLLKVTGIPATEEHALRSRGDDYRRYQKEVSRFIPLPPRRRA